MPECVFAKNTAMLDITPVENLFLAEFMPKAPENYVKAYLFGLMQCYSPRLDGGDMNLALSMDDGALLDAFLYWQAKGLVDVVSANPLMIEYRSVRALSEAGQGSEARRNAKYAELVAALALELGTRMLSGAELAKVYDWIELFGMEESAVILLVRHCIATKGVKVGIKYMDAVAQNWAEARILTSDAAREYLAQYEEITGGAQRILKRWRAFRRPTEDELKLYEKWTKEWGFNEEAIGMACAEMTGTDKPSFGYLNAILETFRNNRAYSGEGVIQYIKQQDYVRELSRMVFDRAGIRRTPFMREREEIGIWNNAWSMPVELIMLAADYAKETMPSFATVKKTVADWHERGIATVAAARQEREALKTPGNRAKKTPMSMNYKQKKYTAQDLKSFGIEILGDDED